jgi:predicted MPP superfamily phosphohydrolase
MQYAARLMDELKLLQAPEGVYAVPGNHDHSKGNFSAIEKLLKTAGIKPLVNDNVRLRGTLPLAGLDDLRAGQPRLRQALRGIEPGEPHVILSHNPRLFSLLTQRNCLVLAGHTHGGQVHLPLTDFRRRPSDMHFSPWFRGWYRQHKAQMYVSSGVGSVHFPMRFRCPPEIAVFTLRAG